LSRVLANSQSFSTYIQSSSQSGNAATLSDCVFLFTAFSLIAFLISALVIPSSLPTPKAKSLAMTARISLCKTLSFIATMRFLNSQYSDIDTMRLASSRKLSNTDATTPPCCLTCQHTLAIVTRAPFQRPNESYFLRILLKSCLLLNADHATHKSKPTSPPIY